MTRDTWLTRRGALKTGASATGLFGLGAGTGTGTGQSVGECSYQLDFVASDPIGTLGASDDAFYGRQNRLIQYAHGDEWGIAGRDTWINSLDPEIRDCVTADPVRMADGTASVAFTVADGCERTFSLVVYPLPDGEFSFGEEQRLAAAATGTFGPGTHELTVSDPSAAVCGRPTAGYERLAKLVPDRPHPSRVGKSVAVPDSGDTAVVGAPDDRLSAPEFGSAYVFGREDDGWSQRAKLAAGDDFGADLFGESVAVSGTAETVLVGADDSAYVFGRFGR